MIAASKKEKKIRIRHLLWVGKWWRKFLCPTLLTTLLMRYTADSVSSWYSSLVAGNGNLELTWDSVLENLYFDWSQSKTSKQKGVSLLSDFECYEMDFFHSLAYYLMCEFGQRDYTKELYENRWILPEISVLEKQGSRKKISLSAGPCTWFQERGILQIHSSVIICGCKW